MRDLYFCMYVSVKHKEYYYQHYLARTKKINDILVFIGILFSTTSIASWAIWQYIPWIWAIFVVIVQVVQAFSPYFPFSKRLASLKFLLPQLSVLMLEIDKHWRGLDEYSDKKINDLINEMETKFNNIQNLYITDEDFPISPRCEMAAEIDCKNYFKFRYGSKEDDTNAR